MLSNKIYLGNKEVSKIYKGNSLYKLLSYDVIVLIIAGQSNARGNTLSTIPSTIYTDLIPNSEIYDYVGNQWLSLDYPTGAVDGLNFGIEFSFAYESNQNGYDTLIGKRAESSTDLFEDWQPNTALNSNLKEAITQAKLRITNDGYTNPYWVFYWNQGERDAAESRTTQQYIDAWNTFMSNLESTQDVIFNQIFICQTHEDINPVSYPALSNIRAAQLAITQSESRYSLIDMSDYPLGGDSLHFQGFVHEAIGFEVFQRLNVNQTNFSIISATVNNSTPDELDLILSRNTYIKNVNEIVLTDDLIDISVSSIISGNGTNNIKLQLDGNVIEGEVGNIIFNQQSSPIVNNIVTGSYSQEAENVFAEYTNLDTNMKDALAEFVDGMVAAGLWNTNSDFILLAGLGSEANALKSMKGRTATKVGTPSWANTTGFSIATNTGVLWAAPSAINSSEQTETGVYTKTNVTADPSHLFGAYNETANPKKRLGLQRSGGTGRGVYHDDIAPATFQGSSFNFTAGFWTIKFDDVDDTEARVIRPDNSTTAITSIPASTQVVDVGLGIGYRNLDGTPDQFAVGAQVLFAYHSPVGFRGTGSANTFDNLVNNLLTNLGII